MTLPSDTGATNESGREPRRNEVLQRVTALIGEHGIDGMTMRQVAHATGLSTGTINYHFGNKRGLVLAALASAGEAPEGSVPGGSPLARRRRGRGDAERGGRAPPRRCRSIRHGGARSPAPRNGGGDRP